ncbi:MAG TPA: ADOP family duplicated permease [Gammaproteobacteria bacterium]
MSISADVRYTLRALRRAPLPAAVSVLTIALGIGATTAIFSVVNAVLLRPLPYADPVRVVRIVENVPAEESPTGVARQRTAMNQEEFDWWRTRSQTLDLAMMAPASRTLRTAEGTVLLAGAAVTPSLFRVRGVQPLLGRGFFPEEERADADVAVVSEATWRRHFGADAGVLGRTIALDGRPHVIVGVMPPEFGDEEFWVPLFIAPPQPNRVAFSPVVARLRDGASLEAAAAEANLLGAQFRGSAPEAGAPPRFDVVRELDATVAPVVPALRVLVVAVVVVLLIACTNIANVLLARGTQRQSEIEIRRSLGATRGRVARLVLTESFVLAGLGGVAGLALAFWGVKLLETLATVSLSGRFGATAAILPRVDEIAIDPTVLAFAAGVTLLTGLLFGALPALRLSRFGEMPRSSAARRPAAPANTRSRTALATVQIAFAATLLVGAGLLLGSFMKLTAVDVGFDGRSVLSFDLVIPGDYSAERKLESVEALVRRLESDSRVSSAGFIDLPPLQPNLIFVMSSFVPEGYVAQEVIEEQAALPPGERIQSRYASAGYLRALGARLVSGRWFEQADAARSEMVALVTRPFAQHYFGDRDPVGTTMQTRWGTLTIVGVVDSLRFGGPQVEPDRIVFLEPRQVLAAERSLETPLGSLDQMFLTVQSGRVAFAVRTAGDPLAIVPDLRAMVGEIDSALAIDAAMPFEQILSGLVARSRFYAVVLAVFGAVAAFIAAIGVYGVLAYVVGLRTNEIGIRMALGAERGAVLGSIMRQGAWMVALGIGAGLAGAAWLGRYLEGMLFGVGRLDPVVYAAAAVAFAAVALLAAYVPARRATRIDPLTALRYE